MADGVCSTIAPFKGTDLCSDNVTISIMLGVADAVVFYGCTPPPVEVSCHPILTHAHAGRSKVLPPPPNANLRFPAALRTIHDS
jgi:hypothetical protein